jgi:hypothetical protein
MALGWAHDDCHEPWSLFVGHPITDLPFLAIAEIQPSLLQFFPRRQVLPPQLAKAVSGRSFRKTFRVISFPYPCTRGSCYLPAVWETAAVVADPAH